MSAGEAPRDASRPGVARAVPERPGIVVTCEHAGNHVPPELSEWFVGAEDALLSHRGWDPGAEEIWTQVAEVADVRFQHRTSRLVVDTNRSATNPKVFSEWSRAMTPALRQSLIEGIWRPYRDAVEESVIRLLEERGRVIHVSVHTFTPVLNGRVRDVDIGLLYDPARKAESNLAKEWKALLSSLLPGQRIRMNRPYQGRSDGFTTALRTRLGEAYLGIELEVNQGLLADGPRAGNGDRAAGHIIAKAVRASFKELVISSPA